MAFNPFTTFQKNRKFWMAAILMICMVTFVFCTGMKGDMSDRIIQMLGRKGPPVAEVGGHNVSITELYDLRTQRNMANQFMMRCAEAALKIREAIEDPNAAQVRAQLAEWRGQPPS